MVHHVTLYKLRPEVTPEIIEEMIRKTRSLLLKIPEVLSVRSGKKIDPNCEWPFFMSLDFGNRHKQAMFRDDPIYLKFIEEVVRPYTTEHLSLDYEMDPGRNVKYS
ncbi:MAG: Dabb family protein [Verrucomicrobiales bacterium]|nr:Dabb family protein [Verrucomicrobiales bacterium]